MALRGEIDKAVVSEFNRESKGKVKSLPLYARKKKKRKARA